MNGCICEPNPLLFQNLKGSNLPRQGIVGSVPTSLHIYLTIPNTHWYLNYFVLELYRESGHFRTQGSKQVGQIVEVLFV